MYKEFKWLSHQLVTMAWNSFLAHSPFLSTGPLTLGKREKGTHISGPVNLSKHHYYTTHVSKRVCGSPMFNYIRLTQCMYFHGKVRK